MGTIYQAVLQLARGSGRRVGKVISELARRGLQREKPTKQRFPTFQVPTDAPVIAASRVQQILDEEDHS